ncbi:MAG TPA: DUF393 domain-containing protein [Coleofasciculaceae cyanobacterium]
MTDSEKFPTSTQSPGWKIKLLYDGDCPLCMREVNFLTKADAGRGLVSFVNIADDSYSATANGGIDYETAMARIHAVLPDGTLIQNVEVFRQVYQILGIGWIYAPTQWPILGSVVDAVYNVWANWRLRLTGRPDLARLVAARKQKLTCDPEGTCRSVSKSNSL